VGGVWGGGGCLGGGGGGGGVFKKKERRKTLFSPTGTSGFHPPLGQKSPSLFLLGGEGWPRTLWGVEDAGHAPPCSKREGRGLSLLNRQGNGSSGSNIHVAEGAGWLGNSDSLLT